MLKSIVALVLAAALSSDVWAQAEASPNQPFTLGAAAVRAPRDAGWKIGRRSDDGIVLSGNTDKVARLAYARLFEFPPPYDQPSFLAEVKRNVETQIFGRPGMTMRSVSYQFSEERGFPCVVTEATVDAENQPGWPAGYSQRFHYRLLLCKVPNAPNQGVLVAFSYTGEHPSRELHVQAEDFVNTLSISAGK